MLVADMVEGADDATLQEAVVRLREILVEDDAAHVRLAVVPRVMAVKVLIQPRV